MSLECKILKSYGLSDIIPFGKYKGKKVKDVVYKHPQWILWAEDNVSGFNVSHRVFKMADRNSNVFYNKKFSEYYYKAEELDYWWK